MWDARLALARLWQVYRQVIQAPTLPDGYRWRSQPMPAVVKELARDCRIVIGPWPGRVVKPCRNRHPGRVKRAPGPSPHAGMR